MPQATADAWTPQTLDFELLYQDVKKWEGVAGYMYLDTAKPPKVTVGAGNMLPNVAAAEALPFFNKATGQPATKSEIAGAFNEVAAMKGSMPAPKYRLDPSIEITEQKAKDLVISRLKREFIPKLRQNLHGFDGYPLPAQRALIDMIYNMGWASPLKIVDGVPQPRHGLIRFEALIKAAEAGDWASASAHCHRKDTNPNKKRPSHAALRNAWTQDLFQQAARQGHPGRVPGQHSKAR